MNLIPFLYVAGIIIGVLFYFIIMIIAERAFVDFMEDFYPNINYSKDKNLLSNKWAPGNKQEEKVK